MKLAIILALALALALSTLTCSSSDNCPVGQTKCQDNQVWICNKSANWNKLDDCNELSVLNGGVKLACVPPGVDGPAACLPVVLDGGVSEAGVDAGSDAIEEADPTLSDEDLACLVLNICEQKDAGVE